ncbi:MAG: hypothetical protein KIT33_08815 [Candidatus Kapabacteria bacterium]|nr:hypothetical protein [Ignavibacteriota bacterium]MCW5885057.1 hypothetical protein [Candidatus Kapabacteria bacterium]
MKNKIFELLALILAAIICQYNLMYSQCGCCSAAFSGSALAAGTSNIGVLKEGSLRIIAMHRALYGDHFYDGTQKLGKFYDEQMLINFTGINIGYGVTKRFTLETEIGAFPDKNINMGYQIERISGFSSINLIGKYTVLADRDNKQEITIGAGYRQPLSGNVALSGNSGGILQLFYFKNLYDDFNLVFLSRAELFLINPDKFEQGNSYINSVFISKKISEKFYGLVEFRYDHLSKSYQESELLINTGRSVLSIVPQLSCNFGKLSVSGFFELPVYKNFNGIQLGESFGAGIALVMMSDLFN